MSNTVDPVAVARAVASLSALADRYVRAHAQLGAGATQQLHVLRLSYTALGVLLDVTTQNERTDLFMTKLAALVPQLTDDELVGAYNVVNLPGLLADGEAWELVEAELTKRDIKVPGTYHVGNTTEVRRPPRCEFCDAEAALIYDTCDHGGGS